MKRKILKAVGYIMLAIGIIGGLSTIDWMFSGNLGIWVVLVVCFCGIGTISLSASKQLDVESESINAEKITKQSQRLTDKSKKLSHYGKAVYNSIRVQIGRVDYLYFKIMLTIIAILLLIIAVELNEKLSEIAYEIYRK